jgi:hypothetical protein
MNPPIQMRHQVRFYTFDNARNQGSMIGLGKHEVYLERITTPTFKNWCCASRELVVETKLTVKLNGRTFIVQENDQNLDRRKDQFEATLPFGFNPFMPVPPPTIAEAARALREEIEMVDGFSRGAPTARAQVDALIESYLRVQR